MKIDARNIAVSFGGTKALAGVSLALEPGAVHALVGENGAGKSTLLKVLGGVQRPEAGAMTIDGAPYAPRDLMDATRRGVALVFQELTINTSLSVAENIFIGQLRRFRKGGFLLQGALHRAAQTILDRLAVDISTQQSLASLDLGQWKCIEIARALSTEPNAVLFDKSTAYLNHREVDRVLAAMRQLKERDFIVAFVSHHLAEVGVIGDVLTILKDGRKVGDYKRGEIDRDEIQRLMVGRDLSEGLFPERKRRQASERPKVLALRKIAGERLEPIDLDLHAGEITGLAGLKGAGGERILEIVAGVAPASDGALTLAGSATALKTPADAWARSVAYLPGDRASEGAILEASVLDNLVMARPPRRGAFFDGRSARILASTLMRRLRIKASSERARAGSLSGGNLQKVVLGKCLAVDPHVLLLNNPTRGVDIGARAEIYRSLGEAADDGLAILMLSEDLNELIGLSDRILVMRSGKAVTTIEEPAKATEDAIVRHMT